MKWACSPSSTYQCRFVEYFLGLRVYRGIPLGLQQVHERSPGYEHDINASLNALAVGPHSFPKDPLDTISLNGIAQPLRN